MKADLVILDANIVTMDPLFPRVEALAVKGGRVAAFGTNSEITAFASASTEVIDAAGHLVLPGFQDTHIHLQDSGLGHSRSAELAEARTVAELQDAIRQQAAKTKGDWVLGTGWYTGIFTDANLTREVLDAVVPDRPCFIYASDGHNACLNSKGCEAVGIRKGAADPFNGHFVLEVTGEPTGLVHEDAVNWVKERMPQPSDDEYEEGVRFGQALCNRHGITGVLDAMVKERHVRIYENMRRRDALTVRVAATAKVEPDEETAAALARLSDMRRSHQSDMFKVHSAKFFLDGVLENRTGAMIEPYSDKGDNAPLMFGHNQIRELFTAFDAARFQIHVHVIGDLAARAALDGLEAARHANGPWPSLHQIAHVQCIDPADIPRFAELGAMMNIQPLWARHEPSVSDVALPMVGEERGKWIYAFRSLIDARAPYCLSSDWGVSTLNPFPIMETAITRQPPRKHGDHPVFLPEQRMTREECVKGYTTHAAAAAWRADTTGSLSIGKFADFIMLDRNIFTCDVYDIGDTQVLLTVLGGNAVHRAG
jgi:hypothetical protein